MAQSFLRVKLSAGYGKHKVLDNFEFDLGPGERLGLIGASGSGKSTLIMSLLGLIRWHGGWVDGKIFFEGQDILQESEQRMRHIRGKRIALIPQSPTTALNNSLRLITHFEEAWRAHETFSRPDLMARMTPLLEKVDLPCDDGFLSRKPTQISVGQAQRVVIALSLLHRPSLLIADEPTSALDAGNRSNVVSLLRSANLLNQTALLYVSHDMLSVLQLCQRMAVLHAGRVVETLCTEEIEDRANHPVTLSLLEALPVPARVLHHFQGGTH